MGMTLEEMKRGVTDLSEEDRLQLAAFLKHLERVDTAANRAELSRLDRAMDAGEYVTQEQWRRLHAALKAEGL